MRARRAAVPKGRRRPGMNRERRQGRGEPRVIGAFARMIGARDRVLTVEESAEQGYAVTAAGEGGYAAHAEGRDAPPEAFVERISDEGGDVYVVPMLEALRQWVKRRRGDGGQADAEGETL